MQFLVRQENIIIFAICVMTIYLRDKMKPKAQTVFITLDDGLTHAFIGKAFSRKKEKRKIVDIKFSLPFDMPWDGEWIDLPVKNHKE